MRRARRPGSTVPAPAPRTQPVPDHHGVPRGSEARSRPARRAAQDLQGAAGRGQRIGRPRQDDRYTLSPDLRGALRPMGKRHRAARRTNGHKPSPRGPSPSPRQAGLRAQHHYHKRPTSRALARKAAPTTTRPPSPAASQLPFTGLRDLAARSARPRARRRLASVSAGCWLSSRAGPASHSRSVQRAVPKGAALSHRSARMCPPAPRRARTGRRTRAPRARSPGGPARPGGPRA